MRPPVFHGLEVTIVIFVCLEVTINFLACSEMTVVFVECVGIPCTWWTAACAPSAP